VSARRPSLRDASRLLLGAALAVAVLVGVAWAVVR
jgi:hypothetical protein